MGEDEEGVVSDPGTEILSESNEKVQASTYIPVHLCIEVVWPFSVYILKVTENSRNLLCGISFCYIESSEYCE